jgi:hypothetical protein
MAEMKKYLDTVALGTLVDQIKAEDSKVLAAAKSHAEGLASNYDAAGAASTVQGKLDEEVIRAKAREDEIAAANAATQKEVDALETLVGVLPEGTSATSVVDYVNVKTAGIATDAALGELNNQVSGLQTVVNGITADYLKGEDKTELSDAIAAEASRADTAEKKNAADIKAIADDYLKAADKTELANAISAETTRATGIEGGLETRLAAVEADYLKGADKTELSDAIDAVAEDVAEIAGDYLKAADKTALEGKIDLKAAQTALDAEIERATGVEESLQTQINTIMNNPDAEGAINSINEFTAYVAEHGTIADGMRTDINKNRDDIAAEVKRAGEAESALSGRLDTLEAINHEAYVAADTALKNELNAEIAKKANAADVAASVEALEGADSEMAGKIAALEAKFTGEGSVADMVADAKQEAIDAAAEDATAKADAAEAAAKEHANGLNTAMNARVEALEAIDHDHANKAELDLIVSGDKAKWDAAAGIAHEHANKTVLDGITSAKVSAWDAAEQNAKTYADGLNTAMTTKVDGVDNRVKALEEAAPDYALDADLDAAVERIAANELAIAANTSAINSFTAITSEEVIALFA